VSGQIGNGDAGFNEELRQALNNLSAILKQAGTSMKKVLNVTVYLRSMQQNKPDEFEDKLKKLLDHLEQDKDGIKRLVDNANGYIQVAMEIHNGNGMIGGPNIDIIHIKRMAVLGLSINFDLYVGGNKFKE
jgi:hypothetical protein